MLRLAYQFQSKVQCQLIQALDSLSSKFRYEKAPDNLATSLYCSFSSKNAIGIKF